MSGQTQGPLLRCKVWLTRDPQTRALHIPLTAPIPCLNASVVAVAAATALAVSFRGAEREIAAALQLRQVTRVQQTRASMRCLPLSCPRRRGSIAMQQLPEHPQ